MSESVLQQQLDEVRALLAKARGLFGAQPVPPPTDFAPDAEAVGRPRVGEEAAVRDAPVSDVVDPHPARCARVRARVGDVEQRLVGGEGEAVRMHHVGDHGGQLPGLLDVAEHEAAAVLLLAGMPLALARVDAVWRVGEPDRAVRGHDDVVRGVEAVPLEAVDDRRHDAVDIPLDAAQAVRALHDLPGEVEGAAVGELHLVGVDGRLAGRAIPLQDAVVRDVAPPHRAGARQPDRPLRPLGSGEEELGGASDEAGGVEAGREEVAVAHLSILSRCSIAARFSSSAASSKTFFQSSRMMCERP